MITPSAAFQQTKRVGNAAQGIYHNILNIAQSVAERGLYSCMVEGSSNRIELFIYGKALHTYSKLAHANLWYTCLSVYCVLFRAQ